jgi:hypothetical protein
MTSVLEIVASQASKPALKVFGSSSFAGDMVITGSGNTSATNALNIRNSSGTSLLSVRNDGRTTVNELTATGTTISIGSSGAVVTIIDSYNNYFTANRLHFYSSPTNIRGINAGGQGIIVSKNIGSGDLYSSSIFAIDSTNQGFLTPRMSEAQRLAIGTPARGLLVYDIDSTTEGLWYYNSGSNPGWQEVLTNSGSQSISGSIIATSFTGSLFGTSSWANNAVSASQAATASSADNFTVRGTLTAQTIVVQTITSSTDFVSGSTIFGNNLSNTHQFTGSVSMTGSLAVVGNVNISGSTTLKSLSGTGSISIAPGSDSLLTLSGFYNVGQTNLQLSSGGSDSFINSFGAGNRLIITNNSGITFTAYSSATQYMHVSSGGVIIGGNSTTPTARLDVSGSSRFAGNMIITGSGNTSATNALTTYNSVGNLIFLVRNDGATIFGGPSVGTFLTTDKGQSINTGAGGMFLGYFATGDLGYVEIPSVTIGRPNNRLLNATTGTQIMGSVVGNYSPTSGTGLFRAFEIIPTINQTGGANGITRGLIISPTITAAADFRAIEWTNNAAIAPSASWGLYGSGSAPNYINGNLSIGTLVTGSALTVSGSSVMSGSLLATNVSTGYIIEARNNSGNSAGFSVIGNNVEVIALNAIVGFVGSRGSLDLRGYSGGSTGNTASPAATIANAFNYNASSTNTPVLTISPSINQTGTAGYTLLDLAPTINTTGSGISYYIKSPNFNVLSTGNVQIFGSVLVTGSLSVIQGITSSLFGTASWAQNAVTASYALTAQTLLGSVVSASYAATASYATSFYVSGSLNIGNTNIEFQENTNVTSGTWRVISSEPTASYKAAFFDYVMFSGSIARAGTVYSVWSASYAEYYENYTGDVGGSTAGVSLQAAISGSNIQLQATALNNGWTIRSLVRML